MTKEVTLYWYNRWSTSRKAKNWLEANQIKVKEVPIVEQPPAKHELQEIWQKSGLPLKKLFNTSGKKYKELQLKDKLPDMSEVEQLQLLSSDGMLIKRPIVVGEDMVTIGFKEQDFEKAWLN